MTDRRGYAGASGSIRARRQSTPRPGSERPPAYPWRIRVAAECNGHDAELTPREFGLLAYLMRHPDQVLSREQILNAVWGFDQIAGVRMLFAIGPEFEEFEPGALIEDTKAGIRLGVGHPHAWKRTAVITDVGWIIKAVHMFTWLVPGEIMVRGLDDLDEAKAWVAG